MYILRGERRGTPDFSTPGFQVMGMIEWGKNLNQKSHVERIK